MAKDERLYVKIDLGIHENPKVAILSDAAFRAFVESICYSSRVLSDGFLDKRIAIKQWGEGVAEELSTNDPVHPSWIPVEGGWMIHDFSNHQTMKADVEAKRQRLSRARSIAGKRGMEARWGSKSVANDNLETETETETEVKDKYIVQFDEFWNAYPRRSGKQDAVKAFKQAVKTVSPEDIVAGAKRYADDPNRASEYTKLPGTWLRAGCWEDEPLPQRGVTKNSYAQASQDRMNVFHNTLNLGSEMQAQLNNQMEIES